MILYKNVDICDLKSIFEKGILSIDECHYDRWEEGQRANNATDCVYLFDTVINGSNTFPNYGAALLVVDIDNAIKVEMGVQDANRGKYREYICPSVPASAIKKVVIPNLFKDKAMDYIPYNINVTWCKLDAMTYHGNHYHNMVYEKATADDLLQFAKTAEIRTCGFNFFRGIKPDHTMIDLYDVMYIY